MSEEKLKRSKTKAKAGFTRKKNRLLMALEGGLTTRMEIRGMCDDLNSALEEVISTIEKLEEYYEEIGNTERSRTLSIELETIERDFEEVDQIVRGCLKTNSKLVQSHASISVEEGQTDRKQIAQSPIDQEIKNLRQEVSKQEEEISKIVRELEASYKYSLERQPSQNADKAAPVGEDPRKNERNADVQSPRQEPEENKPRQEPEENKPRQEPEENRPKQEPEENRLKEEPERKRPKETTEEKRTKMSENVPLPSNKPSKVQDTISMGGYIASSTPAFHRPTSQFAFSSPNPQMRDLSLDLDSSRLLTRVSIPKFAGDKKNYESWKAAFVSCVDKTMATPEYKLLRLHNSLEGEALKVVQSLGYSATAYEIAKERLERKYGGKRRQIILRLDELDKFKQIRDGQARDLERFAELLDVITVNLYDVGQQSELGSGSLYITLQRKLSESLLSKYNRWIFENGYIESVETLREFVNQESEFLTIASETITGLSKENKKPVVTQTRQENRNYIKTFVTQSQPERKDYPKCKLCDKSHGLWNCDSFKAMSSDQRWSKAKELGLCYRCLNAGHCGKSCTRGRTCGVTGCQRSHHRLLHQDRKDAESDSKRPAQEKENQKTSTSQRDETVTTTQSTTRPAPREGEAEERSHMTTLVSNESGMPSADFVALRTVPVFVKNGERSIKINALLDDASTKTYLNSDIAAELDLENNHQEVTVSVLNNRKETLVTSEVEFEIVSVDKCVTRNVNALTTERVTGQMKVIDWSKQKAKWKHLQGINFPKLGTRPVVDMLIGVDQSDLHCSYRDITGEPGEPIARLTPLGWTCISQPTVTSGKFQTNFAFTKSDDLNALVRRFWEIEEPPLNHEILKPEEKTARDTVSNSLSFEDGRYCVGTPWKVTKPALPDNYDMAVRRLQNTEKRLLKSPATGEAYKKVIQQYQEKGYVRKVPPDEKKPEQAWYLPHFPVLRPEKSTTKVRIVFDASARHDGVSLNDMVLQGPKLQNDLIDVLNRFRREPITLMSDIAEMYLQIKLKPEDRPYYRFLWRELEVQKEPDTYEFERVVFGVNSSPFQAQFVARHHAESKQDTHPLGAETILKSTYMDDSMDSVPDEESAIKLYKQLTEIWGSAGMHARKWLSNSAEVLECIPSNDCVAEVDLDSGQLPSVKTLGVLWSPKDDVFQFKINQPDVNNQITKRSFLKNIATLFDPLGLLSPYVIRAKVLLQKMWMAGLDWDDPVTASLEYEARMWFSELPQLADLKVERCLKLRAKVSSAELHTFVDASEEAYGAVVYVLYRYKDGSVSCRLVASKARVAPLHAVSVPRLELMSAVVGLRLTEKVATVLGIQKEHWTFWSDSMDVLYWIRGYSRKYKPFVANRLGEIQQSSSPEQWRYVPTDLNVADLLTRGMPVSKLVSTTTWWNGPDLLKTPTDEWPKTKIEVKGESEKEIKRQYRQQTLQSTFVSQTPLPSAAEPTSTPGAVPVNRLNPDRYSSWVRLKRIYSTVLRFLDNCRVPKPLRKSGPLQPEELINAELYLIKLAQKEVFNQEITALKSQKRLPNSSKLLPLKPVLDSEGILRCDGRLQFADHLPWETRYPIILPRSHQVTRLLIKDAHEQNEHGGTNQTLCRISDRFWVVSAREAIRDWEKECMECRRRKASPAKQVMAPLPELRTRKSLRAFSQASVDFGGPFTTKQGRGRHREKRYLCLFTCLATRAVHLEMAYDLTTDSFLNAFFRMASRRGLPQDVLSDNGTNFVGANNELRELVNALDKDKIQDKTSNLGVKWHFNPPLAPHFSGVHEVMIKAAKRAIYAILSSADVTDEELLSAIVGAEGLINSRPLTYQSANPKDNVPLTPNHFLHGQVGGQFAPDTVDTTTFNPKKRWRRVQELVRHFWHRWMQEWLPGLNRRKKWHHEQDNPKVGDVVIVVSPDTPRGKWPLGRITETFPGKDGHVRVVNVQVGKTVMKRPISRICPL